jgi:hypothetical protein
MREPQIKSTSLVVAAISLEELLTNRLYRSSVIPSSEIQPIVALNFTWKRRSFTFTFTNCGRRDTKPRTNPEFTNVVQPHELHQPAATKYQQTSLHTLQSLTTTNARLTDDLKERPALQYQPEGRHDFYGYSLRDPARTLRHTPSVKRDYEL